MMAIITFPAPWSRSPWRAPIVGILVSWFCIAGARRIQAGPATGDDISKAVAEAGQYRSGDSLEALRRIESSVRQSVSNRSARERIEVALIKLLEPQTSFEAKRFACEQLAIIGGPAALPAISRLLQGDETAGLGCLALSTYPPGKADGILREALANTKGTNRIPLLNALGDRRDPSSLKMLVASARDPDLAAAGAAIAALGKLGTPHSRKAVLSLGSNVPEALSGMVADATLRCAEQLAALGNKRDAIKAYERLLVSDQPAAIRRAALIGLIPLDPDQGESRILAILEGEDSALKPVAIAAVPGLRSKTASEDCSALMRRLTPEEQVWLVRSLAVRGDVQATLAIAVNLSSPFIVVRHAAVEAIGRSGDPSALSLLVRTLHGEKTPEERRWIETALVHLPGSNVTDRAMTLALKQTSGASRASLIVALARREGAMATGLLLDEANRSDPVVSRAAFRSLGRLVGPDDAPALLEALLKVRDAEVRPDAERTTALALDKVVLPARRSTLVREALNRARTVDTRRSVLSLLPNCGDASSLAALEAAAKDPEARIRAAAINTLAEWPDALAWGCLLGAYQKPESESLRLVALRGLVRMAEEENAHPDARLVERYRQLLAGARGPADLKLILGALGDAGHPEALKLVLPFLANPAVRAEAEFAVRQITKTIKTENPGGAEEGPHQAQPAH